jgi:hypothetical protein
VSNFEWVWRYSCFNVTHKTAYKRYEGKTNNLLIEFIGYVNVCIIPTVVYAALPEDEQVMLVTCRGC